MDRIDRIDRIIYECVEEDTRSIAKIGVGGECMASRHDG
jgi:hypothetical protein